MCQLVEEEGLDDEETASSKGADDVYVAIESKLHLQSLELALSQRRL